ncbi:hypothetical protein [Primorskyibacter sp. S187A]|uniref:hypothetical protein n=1 Tax=Primorskyibacter sp. S187A TaxID=3415130 RepID=UPI003C7B8377
MTQPNTDTARALIANAEALHCAERDARAFSYDTLHFDMLDEAIPIDLRQNAWNIAHAF